MDELTLIADDMASELEGKTVTIDEVSKEIDRMISLIYPNIEIHEPELTKIEFEQDSNELFASNDLTDEDKIASSENEISNKLDITKLNIINKYWIKKLGIKVTEGNHSEYLINTGNIIINKNLNKKDKIFLLAHEIKHAITYSTILEQEGSVNTKIVLDELDNIIMNNYDKFNDHTLDRLNYARGQDTETKKMAEIVAILSSEKSVRNDVLKTVYKDKKYIRIIQNIVKAFSRLFNISSEAEEFNIVDEIDFIVKSSKLKIKKQNTETLTISIKKEIEARIDEESELDRLAEDLEQASLDVDEDIIQEAKEKCKG